MIANYYTLRLIAADLENRLAGHFITSAFSQNKNELVIVCSGDNSTAELFLLALCEPSRNALYLQPGFARKKRNTVDLFPQIHGKRISRIALLPTDRDIRFSLEDEFQIIVQMFGSKANVLLANRHGTIVGSFLRPNELKDTTLRESSRPFPEFPANASALAEFLHKEEREVFSSLKERFPLLGSTLIRELLFRAELAEHLATADLAMSQIERLFTCFNELVDQLCRAPSPRIYSRNARPFLFSIVELRMFGNLQTQSFTSIHEALRAFLAASHRQSDTLREKRDLSGTVDREILRVEKTLAKIASELETEERALNYETMGKLLMANLYQIRRG